MFSHKPHPASLTFPRSVFSVEWHDLDMRVYMYSMYMYVCMYVHVCGGGESVRKEGRLPVWTAAWSELCRTIAI